jgi:two-component system, OmpR family, alkaline phosphatase synthesis response regulator PhoP
MDYKGKALVVEDSVEIREYLCEVLNVAGYAAYGCEDGAVALNVARRNEFQVIIIDYHMPNMNGADATRRLRTRFPTSLIIGASSADKQSDFLLAGADVFMKKPCRCSDILALIEQHR